MRRSWIVRAGMAVLGLQVSLPAALGLPPVKLPNTHPTVTYNMLVTLYGWNDNSPPGCAIAYPVVHRCAGETGTYADPITFASDRHELAPGTRIYYRPLKRYFIMEDDCGACNADWSGHGPPDGGPWCRHVDLWAGGGRGDSAGKLFACEDKWTSSGRVPVIVDPPKNEPVAKGPVFSPRGNTCYSGSHRRRGHAPPRGDPNRSFGPRGP